MKTYNVELSTESIAKLTANGGKDIIEHFIEVIGENSPEILSLAINSVKPSFEPIMGYVVGQRVWGWKNTVTTIKEINPLKILPILLANGEWVTAEVLNDKFSDKGDVPDEEIEETP